MDNQQLLLHHLLQKYLVERDINFISVNLRCLLQMFSWVTYWQRVGGKLSRAVYLGPPPRISEKMDNRQILLHHLLQEYLVERDINFISVNLRCLYQMFSWVTYWQGGKEWGGDQAVQGGLSCPSPRISETMNNPQILLHHLLQEYLVERNINFISVSEMLISNFQLGYVLTRGGGQVVQAVYLAPCPEFQRELIIRNFYYTIYYRNI